MDRKSQNKIIRGSFLRLMVMNMLLIITTCVCGLIDNLFIGRVLGKEALAAVGFFSPVTTAVGLSYVLILGAQILTGNFIGAGQTKKVNRLFISTFTVLLFVFLLFSLVVFVFREPLSYLLGAKGEAQKHLCEYIRGYAPGILPQTLCAMFMALCSFNNEIKRSYFSIGALIIGNLLGDFFLVYDLGLYGIGLASSFSSATAFLILLPGFLKKDKLFRFQIRDGFDLKLVAQACHRGMPSLLLTAGVMIKNLCFNFTLDNHVGHAGVAAVSIMATLSALTGAVSAGCYNSYSAIAGIYIGEEDRESLIDLTKTALTVGNIACLITTAFFMFFSHPLSVLFSPDDTSVQEIAQRMFFLGFTYLMPNVSYNIFLQAYRAQNRMLLINILSFAETAMIGFFTQITVKPFGVDMAWLSNTIIDFICLIIVMISVIAFKKKFDMNITAWLKIEDDFGAKENEFMCFSAVTVDDVVKGSQNSIEFCRKFGCSKRIASHVGLCLEEMADNVLEHGFKKDKKYYADVRIVFKDNIFTVRIRDNCREYDPRKRIDMFDISHPEMNTGIYIVSKMSDSIDYYNNAGINTLIMKFKAA